MNNLSPPENFREQTEEISIKGADNYYTAERNSTRLLSILERGNVRDGRGPRGDFSPFSERSPLCLPLSRIPSFRELALPPHRKLSDSAINFARDWGGGEGVGVDERSLPAKIAAPVTVALSDHLISAWKVR